MDIADNYILGNTQRARFTNATVGNMRIVGVITSAECKPTRDYLDTLCDVDLCTAMVESHNQRVGMV